MTSCIAQFSFFFYRPKPIRVDFSGGQISSDAGLLPLRAFDQRHGLTRDLAQRLSDPRADERVRHSTLALLRQQPGQPVPLALALVPTLGPDRNSAHPTVQTRRPHSPDGSLRAHPLGQRLALSTSLPNRRPRL